MITSLPPRATTATTRNNYDAILKRYLIHGDTRRKDTLKAVNAKQIDARQLPNPGVFFAEMRQLERTARMAGNNRSEVDQVSRLEEAVRFDSQGVSVNIETDLRILGSIPESRSLLGLEMELLFSRVSSQANVATEVSKTASKLAKSAAKQKKELVALKAEVREYRQNRGNDSKTRGGRFEPYKKDDCGRKQVKHKLSACTGPRTQGMSVSVTDQTSKYAALIAEPQREYACVVSSIADAHVGPTGPSEDVDMDEAEAVPALEPTFEDASNARILFGVKTSPQTMMKEGLSALDINLGAKRDMSRPMFPRMSEENAEGYDTRISALLSWSV
jgi:hypothetical protein